MRIPGVNPYGNDGKLEIQKEAKLDISVMLQK